MPPKKRNRRGARAASTASTPTIPDSDSAMPDADDASTKPSDTAMLDVDNAKASDSAKASHSARTPVNSSLTPSVASRKNRKEPVNDEWTDEQDLSLFRGLIRWKPVGMHGHFRMIALANYLHNHGYHPEVETHTRPDGIRKHLEKFFDLETLGQREDHIDEDPADPQYIEFELPEEFNDMKWERGNVQASNLRKSQKGKLKSTGKDATQNADRIMEDDETDWNTSPPRFRPSETPPVTGKRKHGDNYPRTRASTMEDTDDSRSTVASPAPTAPATASTTRSVRSNKRATRAGSRQASKDNTVDEEESRAGDDEQEETDDTASVKATTRSNAKSTRTGAQAKGQPATRKGGRKR